MKKALGYLRRADNDFGLINSGDRIAVGLSGGKDSLLLLNALRLYKLFSKKDYSFIAITADPGLGFDPSPLKTYCEENGIEYVFTPGGIVELAIANRKEGKSPCAYCAKLRRGAINAAARKEGCNKVALGHHRDDALETLLMCIFHESRMATLPPRTYLSETGLHVIRPLIYMPEAQIIGAANRLALPVCKKVCPFDGFTERERVKQLIKGLRTHFDKGDEMLFRALRKTDAYNLWDKYRL